MNHADMDRDRYVKAQRELDGIEDMLAGCASQLATVGAALKSDDVS
jgi:hypothetical protein